MADTLAHYVKFARSLALTSTIVLSACGSTNESEEPATTGSTTATTSTPSATSTTTTEDGAGGASLQGANPIATAVPNIPDAGEPQDADVPDVGTISGPLPPPELPASFA
ncbi:Hypothetical protein A7982_11775 [Minicystis rosea]|nr:Hypothetical protein A7982_11775 [Minicystis rosea]